MSWTKLTAYYGNPGTGETASASFSRQLTTINVPWEMYLAWNQGQPVTRMTVHRKSVPYFLLAFHLIEQRLRRLVEQKYGTNLNQTQKDMLLKQELVLAGLHLFGGTYNHRKIRGSITRMSTHALGIAIDIDPTRNSLGDNTPHMPLWVVECFEEAGFVAGYRWTRRRDAMHFELSNITKLATVRVKHSRFFKTVNIK